MKFFKIDLDDLDYYSDSSSDQKQLSATSQESMQTHVATDSNANTDLPNQREPKSFLSIFNPCSNKKKTIIAKRQELMNQIDAIEYKTDETGNLHFSCEEDREQYCDLHNSIRNLPNY